MTVTFHGEGVMTKQNVTTWVLEFKERRTEGS